jgi:hypothetical protein
MFFQGDNSLRRIVHHHHVYGTTTITPSKASQRLILCSGCNIKVRQARRLTAIFFSETINGVDFQLLAQGFSGSKVVEAIPIAKRGGQMVGLELNKILKIIDFSNFRMDGTIWELASEMEKANEPFPLLNEFLRAKNARIYHRIFVVRRFPP